MAARDDGSPCGTVVTPGNHDGVHRGHQALLATAREIAVQRSASVTALTFDPHPAQVLAPAKAPPILTTIERRRALLREFGADAVEVLTFDRALAAESPESFVVRVLVTHLQAKGVVIGPDFRFGRGAKGDVALLREMGAEHDFVVRTVGPVQHAGATVSSSRIRAALIEGDVITATGLLGRVHDVAGEVVEGDQRGRTIGVPTANLAPPPGLLPADGVYAVVARVDGDALLHGVANLGVRPTFNAGRSLEVHLFDFDRDIYGARLRVGFVERLRGEQKFSGIDALKAQIAQDIEDAGRALGAEQPASWSWI